MDANKKKNALYSLILVVVLVGIWWFRSNTPPVVEEGPVVEVTGETMGTTYTIKYLHEGQEDLKPSIDSVLRAVNQSLSTYIPDSEISLFNKGTVYKFQLPYFFPVLERSLEVYKKTYGAFDPTIGPLVNVWGFGPDDTQTPDSSTVDSLMQYVGFDSVYFDSISVCKLKKGVKLDLSAIAKGYGVDVVAAFLKGKGIENMMVEIGGEVICFGRNSDGNLWKIGINNPLMELEGESIQAVVKLVDKALATSGNYRNYYIKDGVKYAHTISPKTGYPVTRSLLSASVFANDCMTADAYATAFMVLGVDSARNILRNTDNLDAFLVFSDSEGKIKTYSSAGIKPFIKE